ncbi:MAG: ferredoxin family protein [Rhodospirillales bacterium]|jgi:NAD-dependent dihydropyrimidine dehydrogenase PreA subunit|nr:ferredoxin family protein [Rhodospirillales bacterium]MDP6842776.1 ferredoxin family protein [Rhodospirillales bacterium]
MPAAIIQEKCNGCGLCEMYCPLDVIHMEGDMAVIRYPDECWHCGACRLDCEKGAVKMEFSPSMLNI